MTVAPFQLWHAELEQFSRLGDTALRAQSATIILALIFASCHSPVPPAVDAEANKRPDAKALTPPPVGRFIVLPIPQGVIRMDTTTGETWRLNVVGEPRWESLEDNLHPVVKYGADGKKMTLRIVLPDGRDLRDVSKDEILRWVEPILVRSAGSNTRDPLGLR